MRRQLMLVLIVAAAFGFLVPWFKGFGFLDRRIIIAYACLAAVFAVPGATDAFAETSAAPLRTMLRVWLFSWGYATAILALALIVVNVLGKSPQTALPRTSLLVAAECLGLTLSAAVTAIAGYLTLRTSAASTIRIFRTVFLVVIVGFFLADRFMPSTMTTAALVQWVFIVSGVCAAVAVVCAARFAEKSPPVSDRSAKLIL